MAPKSGRSDGKTFVFRKHTNVGAADAIDDKKYLIECFIDNGELEILLDLELPQCIVTGRTGSGKTALLEQIEYYQEKVIKIPPEGLALTYVANNEVLNFFTTAGVNMDLFYRLLWRHVFAVEIIREHYKIVNERTRDNFLTQLMDRIRGNASRKDAVDYFLNWGDKFWLESDVRVMELTQRLEKDLGASVDATLKSIIPTGWGSAHFNTEVARNLTEEQKSEIVNRGQKVVDSVQMKHLSEIMDLLANDIMEDKKKKYYITIDRLDENWVNDHLRYSLIRALLDTVREFNNKIKNVKIIVAIREDLLDRVFRYTRSYGYQEEKYKSMYLNVTWKADELINLLDKRVQFLVKQQYTNKPVFLKDLLPNRINKEDPLKYITSRTMLRPRDMIMFFNECIKQAEGKPKLSQSTIYAAEAYYSDNRLRALADEWSADYANLYDLVCLFKKFPATFKWEDHRDLVEMRMMDFLISSHKEDEISLLLTKIIDGDNVDDNMREIFSILYKVGAVGVKKETFSTISWSYLGQKVMKSEINPSTTLAIHPACYRVLGINPC